MSQNNGGLIAKMRLHPKKNVGGIFEAATALVVLAAWLGPLAWPATAAASLGPLDRGLAEEGLPPLPQNIESDPVTFVEAPPTSTPTPAPRPSKGSFKINMVGLFSAVFHRVGL